MHPAIFAFDFSMNKPAMCSLINNKINFYVWPASVDNFTINALEASHIHVFHRDIPPIKDKSLNEHELICEHVNRAANLANLITSAILEIASKNNIDVSNIIIANEGLAFGSSGDAVLDLSGYKYILMYTLMSKGIKTFKTYSPIAIKSTAGCAKRGLKKEDMIAKLSEENQDLHPFIHTLACHSETLKKKTAFVKCVDDLTDAYWCLRTVIKKEELNTIFSE